MSSERPSLRLLMDMNLGFWGHTGSQWFASSQRQRYF